MGDLTRNPNNLHNHHRLPTMEKNDYICIVSDIKELKVILKDYDKNKWEILFKQLRAQRDLIYNQLKQMQGNKKSCAASLMTYFQITGSLFNYQ